SFLTEFGQNFQKFKQLKQKKNCVDPIIFEKSKNIEPDVQKKCQLEKINQSIKRFCKKYIFSLNTSSSKLFVRSHMFVLIEDRSLEECALKLGSFLTYTLP
ncbi:hypothetical protein BpHYR1_017397, partial [Brachionus plicatilis]